MLLIELKSNVVAICVCTGKGYTKWISLMADRSFPCQQQQPEIELSTTNEI